MEISGILESPEIPEITEISKKFELIDPPECIVVFKDSLIFHFRILDISSEHAGSQLAHHVLAYRKRDQLPSWRP